MDLSGSDPKVGRQKRSRPNISSRRSRIKVTGMHFAPRKIRKKNGNMLSIRFPYFGRIVVVLAVFGYVLTNPA